jgi:hypothetical protein
MTKHRALALLGRFAASDDNLREAATLLAQAHDVARAGLETSWWDLNLPRTLAERGAEADITRAYLTDLVDRAETEGEDRIAKKATEVLSRYG